MSVDDTTLWLRISRSIWTLAYLLISHLLALVVLWTLPMLIAWQVLGIFFVLVSLYFHLGRQQWWHNDAHQRAVVGLRRDQSGYWQCDFADGTAALPYQFMDSFVLPTVVIIRLKATFECTLWQRYRTVILIKNATEARSLRQLRIWLVQNTER